MKKQPPLADNKGSAPSPSRTKPCPAPAPAQSLDLAEQQALFLQTLQAQYALTDTQLALYTSSQGKPDHALLPDCKRVTTLGFDLALCTRGIRVGDVFPSYRALAAALGEKVTTGESRQLQLSFWSTFLTWEREGNKYRILDVNADPLLPTVLEGAKASWTQPCTQILLEAMATAFERRIRRGEAPVSSLGEYLSTHSLEVTPPPSPTSSYVFRYTASFTDLLRLMGLEQCQTRVPEALWPSLTQLFSDALRHVLASLKKRHYIHWDIGVTYQPSSERGSLCVPREATFEECTRLEACKGRAVRATGAQELWQVIRNGKLEQYQSCLQRFVRKELAWDSWDEFYRLGYTPDTLQHWLRDEYKRMESPCRPLEQLAENVEQRVARWIREYVEECRRLGVFEGNIAALLLKWGGGRKKRG